MTGQGDVSPLKRAQDIQQRQIGVLEQALAMARDGHFSALQIVAVVQANQSVISLLPDTDNAAMLIGALEIAKRRVVDGMISSSDQQAAAQAAQAATQAALAEAAAQQPPPSPQDPQDTVAAATRGKAKRVRG